MSKGALAFLAGLGSGYLSEGRRQEDKARQEKFDQIRFDEADRAKSEWDLNEKKRKDIAEAAKDGGEVVEDAQVVSGLAAKPATYQDKDLAASDTREGNRMLRQAPGGFAAIQGISQPAADPSTATGSNVVPMAVSEGVVPRESATPTGSQAQPIATQQGVTMTPLGRPMFQGKEYADSGTSKNAAESFNSPDARNARIAQAMRANGDHEGAMRIEANAKQAALQDFQMKVANHNWSQQIRSEGVSDAFKALKLGDSAGMVESFNKSGKYKIVGDAQITPSQIRLPDGSTRSNNIAVFNIAKQDGTVVPMKISTDELEKTLIKAEDFAKINIQAEADALKRKFDADQTDKQLKHSEKMQQASLGAQYARLAQDERHYQDGLPAGKIKNIEAALKDYTMPTEKRKELLGIDNLDQKTRLLVNSNLKESDQLQAAMNTAMAKGEWLPDSTGAKALQTRQVVLSESLRNLLGGTTTKKSADPLGLYGADTGNAEKPPSQAASAVAPNKPPVKPVRVPRASEYKGEADSQQLWSNLKSIAATVGSGIKTVGDNYDKIEKTDELRKVRSRIESNLMLTEAQKKFAIDNGLLTKD
ncbi:hypothetical protein [Undibacterium umbellatum]|uniref:Uncharacterized protein n=1 Tax=Undibacterium umbellatum TaxID=2762300 RepID=A0ABR6Z4C1_9BURK|nr:hypothetical protein [Undibacterium umbellatum]MBC3906190.1 hypothetical protein [Undibacterium umbellatum]